MIILLDCDGVLSDFTGGLLKAINRRYGTRHRTEDVTTWKTHEALGLPAPLVDEIAAEPGFCIGLEPYPGAPEAVKELEKLGDVWIVTSPHIAKTWAWERTEWLEKHFGIDRKRVIHAADKQLIYGDIFIDDKPENLDEWRKRWAFPTLLWDQPYNRSYPAIFIRPPFVESCIIRVKSWEQVLSHVRSLRNKKIGAPR